MENDSLQLDERIGFFVENHMSLSIYLYFEGCCRQAFDHYKSVFEAEEICRQFYSNGPVEMFGNEPADRIMHTTIRIGETKLMGSDRMSTHEPIVPGNNFSVTYHPSSKEEADRLFPILAEGGDITMPLQETSWGSYFGLCTDRFGILWMFNYSN